VHRVVGCFIGGFIAACGGREDCPVGNPADIVDSTGMVFAIDEHCRATPRFDAAELYDCGGRGPGILMVWGRFISVGLGCVYDGDIHTGVEAERPVACDANADCPILYGDAYECQAGLCQHRDVEEFTRDTIDRRDAALMCFGPIDRELTVDPQAPAVQLVDTLVEQACPDGSCAVPLPDECLQP
jgi:hypothetical protein